MWDHIINIYLSGSLSTKTKESRINESQKKKKKNMDHLHFIYNNIHKKFF